MAIREIHLTLDQLADLAAAVALLLDGTGRDRWTVVSYRSKGGTLLAGVTVHVCDSYEESRACHEELRKMEAVDLPEQGDATSAAQDGESEEQR